MLCAELIGRVLTDALRCSRMEISPDALASVDQWEAVSLQTLILCVSTRNLRGAVWTGQRLRCLRPFLTGLPPFGATFELLLVFISVCHATLSFCPVLADGIDSFCLRRSLSYLILNERGMLLQY